jgi:hypothetical protein
MSLSNATETAVLDCLLRGTDPSFRAGASLYVALFTSTATTGELEAGTLTNEANYTGYSRKLITKSSAWTGTSSPFSNSGLIQFDPCTAGTNTIRYFAIVDTASGAVGMMISGQLASDLSVSSGIQPQFAAGALQVSAD